MNYRILFVGVFLLAVFLFLLQAAFIMQYREIIPAADPAYYFSYVRSVVIDGDLNLINEYKHFKVPFYEISPLGLPILNHTIGFPLLTLPFYAVTHGIITLLNIFGFDLNNSGYSPAYQLAFCLSSIFYGCIGLYFCFLFLKNYFTEQISVTALALILLTTNLFYYIAVEPFMSHACSFFTVALFFYLWQKTTTSDKRIYFFWLGIVAGLMISVRQQNLAFIAVVPLGYLWNNVPRRLLGLLKAVPLAVSGLLLGFLPQMLAWKVVFGSWLADTYGKQSFIYKFDPKILQVLFSSEHGLLSWHPVIIICLIGLLLSIRRYSRIGVLFFTAFLMQLYINSSWWCYWLENSFGYRGFVSSSLIFAFGMAYILSLDVVKIKSWKFIAASTLLGLWNMILAAAYLTKMIPQTESFAWSSLFINIWRLPMHIIYRMHNF